MGSGLAGGRHPDTPGFKTPRTRSDDQKESRQANARPAEAGFVEAVLEIQRHVSAGAPREDTYQSIVNEGVQLLSADSGALRL